MTVDTVEADETAGKDASGGRVARRRGASWVNRLIWWIDARPGPAWAWYAGAMAVGIAVANVSMWAAGRIEPGTLDLAQSYYGAIPFILLLALRYLDGAARAASRVFRPVLEVDDATYAKLVDDLTVLPPRPPLVIVGAMLVLTALNLLGDPRGARIEGLPAPFVAMRYVAEVLVSSLFLVVGYHTVRQLRTVTRIHERATQIDLFRPVPLHAFAALTTRTAVVLALLVLSSVAADIEGWQRANAYSTMPWFGGGMVIACLAFTVPLLGIHRRIVSEKHRLQEANAIRLTGTTSEIHGVADTGDLGRVDGLNKLLASLIAERDLLARLPTWPWQPGQIGAVVSAVVLPVALFVVTRVLGEAL